VRETLASGKVTVAVSGTGVPAARSDAHVQAVAGTVERLVREITSVDDSPYFCLMGIKGDGAETPTLKAHCDAFRARQANAMEAHKTMTTAIANKITTANAADAIKLLNAWAQVGELSASASATIKSQPPAAAGSALQHIEPKGK
jgi:hypothetical protein